MKTTAILGLGLMGASLGLALRRAGVRVAGYARRAETRAQALSRGICDRVHEDPAEAVHGADLCVLCVPIASTVALVRAARSGMRPGLVVTDVGSTKEHLMRDVPPVLPPEDITFVGSHPMAGSEQQGIDAARVDLYRDALVVVTPPRGASSVPRAVERVETFWRHLEARVVRMDAAAHDHAVARTSHLPHLAAALLSQVAGRKPAAATLSALCGAGLRDSTRIAAGSPRVWRDIVATNVEALSKEWDLYMAQARQWQDALNARDYERIEALLQEGCRARERLCGRGGQRCGEDS